MHETLAMTITSLRERSEEVVERRRRSMMARLGSWENHWCTLAAMTDVTEAATLWLATAGQTK